MITINSASASDEKGSEVRFSATQFLSYRLCDDRNLQASFAQNLDSKRDVFTDHLGCQGLVGKQEQPR